MKRILLTFFVLACAAIVTAEEHGPFVWPSAWTTGEAVLGGQFRDFELSGARTFNPFVTSESAVIFDVSFYTVPLIMRNPATRQWIPYAAESFEFSEDGLTAVVQVRKDMKWSDGEPVTAADFVFYYDGVVDDDVASARKEDWVIGEDLILLEATGEYELTFTFPKADRLAMNALQTYPVPDHILGEIYREGGAAALTAAWGLDSDVSETVWAGPFVPVIYDNDERTVFKKNPYFGEWNVDEQGNPQPLIDEVVYTVASQEAALNLYVGGELDVYGPNNLDALGVVAAAIDAGEIDAELYESVYSQAGTTFYVFNWNQASNPFKEKLFRSPAFRQAMSHLTPREAMVDLVHQGAAVPAYAPVGTPYTFWYPENPKTYPYNPEAALELLAAIGFSGEKSSDGCLVDADGNEIKFTLSTNAGNANREQEIQLIADAAREVGVCVDTLPLDFSLLVDQLTGVGDDRAFDAILIGFSGGQEDWPFFEGIFSCTGGFHMWNLSGDCLDPQERLVAALNQSGRGTLDDDEAQQIGYELMDAYAELQPMIYTTSGSLHRSWLTKVGGSYPESFWSSFNGTRHFSLSLTYISE